MLLAKKPHYNLKPEGKLIYDADETERICLRRVYKPELWLGRRPPC